MKTISETSSTTSEETREEKELYIWLRATGEKVPVSREVFDAYYDEADRTRKKEQYYGRCYCPQRLVWKCDGDCLTCPFHREGNELSLNVPGEDEEGEEWGDSFYDPAIDTEAAVEMKLMLEKVIARLRELDPDADRMISLWYSSEKISDREMARKLGRNEDTFKSQVRRYRKELKKFF